MEAFRVISVLLFILGNVDISTSRSARFLFDTIFHSGDFALCPACCPCYDYTKDYGKLTVWHPYHQVKCQLSDRPDCDYHYDQCKDYCVSQLSTNRPIYEPSTYPSPHVNNPASVTSAPVTSAPVTSAPMTADPMTSAPMTLKPVRCEKLKVLDAVALNMAVTLNNNIHKVCTNHPENSPSDDLVYSVCDVTPPSDVYKGSQVITNCQYHKPYTAIKAFPADVDNSNLSLATSGVFIECVPNGFKMVVQSCESAPYILTIATDSHQGALAPQFYHIIMA
ncbi:uncharacterized protein LOC117318116 [Pecten maximus]|uniref:uncharacterized protein LOC117318116 n=1 Tax=Pecten maximus TaxID=6579 RepID=UPI001458C0EC|nr:uncharacterized protein LOC117318116 [Pecten maximus]